MIATWMLYCLLCALGLSACAVLAERTLLAGRGPVRHVWIGAIALSLLIPAAALFYAPRPSAQPATSVGHDIALDSLIDSASTATVAAPVVVPRAPGSAVWNWHATMQRLARADEPLTIAWLALSSLFAVYFVVGIIALAWMRRRWQQRDVLGIPVFVSTQTGPAVVGAMSPAIVVPEWALAMEPTQLALMLRHEQEHRQAGDGRLLTAAHVALIAMPWNGALWWLVFRLRIAIELDCDARVLRDADARSYGDLLLEVARPRRGPRLLGATAFVERAGELERRIRFMARRDRASRGARAAATCIGILALTAAWVAPRPAAPARATPPRSVTPLASVPLSPTAPQTIAGTQPRIEAAPSKPAEKLISDTGTGVALSPAGKAPTDRDTSFHIVPPIRVDTPPPSPTNGGVNVRQIPGPFVQRPLLRDDPHLVDSLFHRLFDGIALTADQEAKARDMIDRLEQDQLAQDALVVQALISSTPKRFALQTQRDSALRALLTTDDARADFDARVAPPARGGPGRSGGPVPDSLNAGRGGGRGGGPGGRGGNGGGRQGGGRGAPPEVVADATFHRLFDGIPLTPDQEASARATILKAQQDMTSFALPVFPVRLGWRAGPGAVIMQAQSDSAFVALLTNDADRAVLQSRINIAVPPARPPQ